MKIWVRIEDGTVQELTDQDPTGRYHPALLWVQANSKVAVGWTYDGGKFAPPLTTHTANDEIMWRDNMLSSTDHYVLPDSPLNDDRLQEITIYRQALRDWPDNKHFPEQTFRPTAPAWL